MTREEARVAAQVLLAFAGEDLVEFKMKSSAMSAWTLQHENDRWDFENRDYRIKPKPREWWVLLQGSGRVWGTFSSLDAAKKESQINDQIIKVREVIE